MLISPQELAEHREDAESRMGAENGSSTCDVRRKTRAKVKVAGLNVDQWVTAHQDLPMRLDGSSTGDGGISRVVIGDIAYDNATGVAHFPALTEDLRDDDLLDVTAGDWAGSAWRVVKAVRKDQATARRVPIVEVPRPAGWD